MTARSARRWMRLALIPLTLVAVVLAPVPGGAATVGSQTATTRYLVVYEDGASATAALAAVRAAGGAVVAELSTIGVAVVETASATFADVLRASEVIAEVGQDVGWKALPDGTRTVAARSEDLLEPLQWDMRQIRTREAHGVQMGNALVDVGVLDSGVDSRHPDFVGPDGTSNVDCSRARDFVPAGPGIGNPDPCGDNQFHGTHVAGTIAARANGIGVVGVAPDVTLVPVKVCDAAGYCYFSSVVRGIEYAASIGLDVVNMSFFVDDDEFLQSTEFKCMDDPTQRAFRTSVERAIQYARNRGVTPVAALGNSDQDLADPDLEENNCEVVPAETQGVIGTVALGPESEKASYSNYGVGAADVSAPGGNGETGDCTTTILSTVPGGAYGCFQGTSMASPHAAGVAALIVSQFGGPDGEMSPTAVEQYLQSTTIDIGIAGYDQCFGNGRIDALRAVQHDTSGRSDPSAPHCPEYAE